MTQPDVPQTSEAPPGAVGIFTDKHGRVIASVSDFDRSGYGGFTLYQGQKVRVRRKT